MRTPSGALPQVVSKTSPGGPAAALETARGTLPRMEKPRGGLAEVALEAGSAIVGDLHLDVGAGAARPERFEAWLAGLRDVPRLMILGDLFDAWIGPAQAELPAARSALGALRGLASRGTAIDVVPGNRDFLLEEGFERASGATVRPGGLVGVLEGGARVLLIHGDELCTLDRGYQRLRRVLRSAPVRWSAPRVPRPAALWVARRLRRASTQALAVKLSAETEQQVEAVRELARFHGASTLICGHAHRFRDETLAGGPRWIVVGAFGGPRDLLRVAPGGAIEARESGAA
ncbi:MAG TPA: metallophosphoesterase [Planctomycetota bacterium]|nr:metallophosphoesterase [Planctomycetota bacterium]